MENTFNITAEEEKWIMAGVEDLTYASEFFDELCPEGPSKEIRDIQVLYTELSAENSTKIPQHKKQALKTAYL